MVTARLKPVQVVQDDSGDQLVDEGEFSPLQRGFLSIALFLLNADSVRAQSHLPR